MFAAVDGWNPLKEVAMLLVLVEDMSIGSL
jgi:hypothetical protein